ncbi:MAG TPA: hypothetical protein VFJ74_18080 [Gemmatimonadaceae bacterium]|nr:hypothetical protein [Gemmatimonadaceae bacterium]
MPVARAVRWSAALAACAMAGLPGSARAQTQLSLAAHAARDFALPNAPYLYGASLATYTGAVGVRIGGALGDVRQVRPADAASGETRLSLGAWAADADVIIAPAQIRAVRTALGGLGPYAFVGIGTQGVRRAPLAEREAGPAWSYGGGLAQPLLGALYLETEARYRIPIVVDGRQPPSGFVRAWDYRVGLALRFGGRHDERRDEPPRGERRRGRRSGGNDDWDRAREPR